MESDEKLQCWHDLVDRIHCGVWGKVKKPDQNFFTFFLKKVSSNRNLSACRYIYLLLGILSFIICVSGEVGIDSTFCAAQSLDLCDLSYRNSTWVISILTIYISQSKMDHFGAHQLQKECPSAGWLCYEVITQYLPWGLLLIVPVCKQTHWVHLNFAQKDAQVAY